MINLFDIQNAYLTGSPITEINEMYKVDLENTSDEEKVEIWKQVCTFANFEMIEYLLSLGWRAMGVVDQNNNTLLHFLAAAEFDRSYYIDPGRIYESTKMLLANKVSPLRKNAYDENALISASDKGYFEMLQAYIDAGLKLDWTDSEGNTILHHSAQNSAQYYSSFTDAQDRVDDNYQSPLFDESSSREVHRRKELEWKRDVSQARFNHFINFIALALEAGLDPNQKNNYKETPIDFAIKYKAKGAGALLKGDDLSNEETLPLYFLAGGQTIFQACINSDVEAIEALIKLGENLNEAYDKEGDRYNGMVPLSIAVILHQFEIVDLLLKNGADASLLDSKSWHPLRHLFLPISTVNTSFDQFEKKVFQNMMKSFIAAGFDCNAVIDDDENTVLTLSAKEADRLEMYNGHTIAKKVIEELVFADADLNVTNKDGISAVMYLCQADLRRAENELITLLEQGALTDLKDRNGKTALMYAASNSDHSTAKTYCELLAQFGEILVDAKDNSEKTALDYAVEKDNENLVSWLLERL